MTTTYAWTLQQSSAAGERSVTGQAEARGTARTALLGATQAAIAAAGPDTAPRYRLHLDGDLLAIITTGRTEDGSGDHALAAHHVELINRT